MNLDSRDVEKSYLLRRSLPILILLLAGSYVYKLYLFKKEPPKRPIEEMAALVQTITAESGSESIVIEALGVVMPARKVTLHVEVSGTVQWKHPSLLPGGRLNQGDELLRIDARDYVYALAQQTSTVERARFELELEESRKVVAEEEWSLFTNELSVADGARALVLREPQLRAARAGLIAAESGMCKAALNLERTAIKAPFNALVRRHFVDIGQLATPQTPIAELVGTDEFWIKVTLPLRQLHWIKLPENGANGACARVFLKTDEHNQTAYPATVIRLYPDLETAGRMARLLLSVREPLEPPPRKSPNPLSDQKQPGGTAGLPLFIGAHVQVEIDGPVLEDVFVLPAVALREGSRIWIMNESDRLDIREVDPVWESTQAFVLADGIRSGEKVVIGTLPMPVPKMKLREKKKAPRDKGSGSELAGDASAGSKNVGKGGAHEE